jgi:hypothetical protein
MRGYATGFQSGLRPAGTAAAATVRLGRLDVSHRLDVGNDGGDALLAAARAMRPRP